MAAYQTVVRAGEVLDLCCPAQQEWGPTEVASTLGISKSQAHRALASFTDAGLLRRVPSGRYRLGWRLVTLSALALSSCDFGVMSRRMMVDLVERFGDTLTLAVWDRGRIVGAG